MILHFAIEGYHEGRNGRAKVALRSGKFGLSLQVVIAALKECIDSLLAEGGIGVVGGNLLDESTSIGLEAEDDGAVVLGGQNEAHSFTLGDLDLITEDIVVVVAKREGRDGHDLRNGAEGEDGGVLEVLEIVEAIDGVLQRISDQFVNASKSVRLVLIESQILDFGGILRPDSARPEETGRNFADVLEVVTNDVGLLQEQSH